MKSRLIGCLIGVFNERVTIRKPVRLVGAGTESTILGPTEGEQAEFWDKLVLLSREIDDTMRVTAQAKIDKSLVAACWGTGVTSVDAEATVRIIDSDIRNNYHYNISLRSDSCVIEGCRISGTAWSGISCGGTSPRIVRNVVFNNNRGIYSAGSEGIVKHNLIYHNQVDDEHAQDESLAIVGNRGNRLADPQAVVDDQRQVVIGDDDIARRLELKELPGLSLGSRWSITPEELAMIPDDGTVDSSKWKMRPEW